MQGEKLSAEEKRWMKEEEDKRKKKENEWKKRLEEEGKRMEETRREEEKRRKGGEIERKQKKAEKKRRIEEKRWEKFERKLAAEEKRMEIKRRLQEMRKQGQGEEEKKRIRVVICCCWNVGGDFDGGWGLLVGVVVVATHNPHQTTESETKDSDWVPVRDPPQQIVRIPVASTLYSEEQKKSDIVTGIFTAMGSIATLANTSAPKVAFGKYYYRLLQHFQQFQAIH
ncbi:hypothetical protein ACLOJK_041588 [Asimina triloba]